MANLGMSAAVPIITYTCIDEKCTAAKTTITVPILQVNEKSFDLKEGI